MRPIGTTDTAKKVLLREPYDLALMQRGVGIEFSQYRGYEVGDELSRIDWKLFARSDRYFVREAERESEIDIWFLLDVSSSMLQSSQPGEKPNKFIIVHK